MKEEELIETVPRYDGWIIGDDPATARVFAAGVSGKLRAAVKWGVGVDNVDFEGASLAGISVTNTPGMFSDGTMPVPTTDPVTTLCARAAIGRLRIISRLNWRSWGRWP